MKDENLVVNESQETPADDAQQEVVLSKMVAEQIAKHAEEVLGADRFARLKKAYEFGYRAMGEVLSIDKLSLIEIEKIIDDAHSIARKLGLMDGGRELDFMQFGYFGGQLKAVINFEEETNREAYRAYMAYKFDDDDVPF